MLYFCKFPTYVTMSAHWQVLRKSPCKWGGPETTALFASHEIPPPLIPGPPCDYKPIISIKGWARSLAHGELWNMVTTSMFLAGLVFFKMIPLRGLFVFPPECVFIVVIKGLKLLTSLCFSNKKFIHETAVIFREKSGCLYNSSDQISKWHLPNQ